MLNQIQRYNTSFSGADIRLDLVKSASKVYTSFSGPDIGLDLVKSDSKL